VANCKEQKAIAIVGKGLCQGTLYLYALVVEPYISIAIRNKPGPKLLNR
jgi:hypothetical protein